MINNTIKERSCNDTMLRKFFGKKGVFQKLLLTHLMIAVTIIVTFCFVFVFSYRAFIYDRNANDFQEINRQISINVDSFFYRFIKLSETPYYTYEVRYALENGIDADYIPGSTQIAARDMAIRMFLAEQRMHSLYITFDKMGTSYSRGYNGASNITYDVSQEEWFSELYELRGAVKVLPLHPLYCEKPDSAQVLSVGRCIVKPFTLEPLGIMVVNIKPESLRSVLEEPLEIPGMVTYVVDENGKIAYSTSEDKSNLSFEELNLELDSTQHRYTQLLEEEEVLVVSEVAEDTGLRIVSIVPIHDLNHHIDTVVNICIFVGVLLLIFAAVVAYAISKTITEPIRSLTKEMIAFESDGRSVELPKENADEIAYLHTAFQDMVKRIEDLIQKVIEEGEQKQQAEILALQSQINPHFMYNSLNTIKLMAEMQGDMGISRAINTFSELLRYCTRSPESEVPTSDEILFIDQYIDLMRLRYFNRFTYRRQIDEKIWGYRMLQFVLQPFMENAIFHGFAAADRSDYFIELRGQVEDTYLDFYIEDNGMGFQDTELLFDINAQRSEKMTSIGIANVISRIRQHYGSRFGVFVKSGDTGTTINIRLPRIK